MKWGQVYQWSVLIGYTSEIGFIEKHYSNYRNFASPQKIDYRIPIFEKAGKQYVFRTLKEAKEALEKEAQLEKQNLRQKQH